MKLLFLILLVAFHQTWSVQAAQGCLTYEPNAVALHGRIGRHTFAGSPNYESVAKGDEGEHVWVPHLAKPICVDASSDWEREGSASDIQLVFPKGQIQYDTYRSLLGRRVIASGTLFRAHTGHHHTKVLLTVTDIKEGNGTKGKLATRRRKLTSAWSGLALTVSLLAVTWASRSSAALDIFP